MNKKKSGTFSQRKEDHIHLALHKGNRGSANGLDQVQLTHCALPEMDFHEVDISTSFLNQRLLTPFVVSGMTAGWQGAKNLNHSIADLCHRHGWIMGVGSQRKELETVKSEEWSSLRKEFPSLVMMGNIGLSQLIKTPLPGVQKLVSSLQAQAMVVHSNPLQECLQPEGTPEFKGGVLALKNLCQNLGVPVILKEVGFGFSRETLEKLTDTGLYAVDISGYGGTHFGNIEGQRVKDKKHKLYGVAKAFKYWGISTRDSLLMAQKVKKSYQIWASGGIKDGHQAAKAISLGAARVSVAGPILKALMKGGEEEASRFMTRMEYGLKVAMFCTGSKTLSQMQTGKVKSPVF